MGVRWLTTYVKNVEKAVSSEVRLSCEARQTGDARTEPDGEARRSGEEGKATFVVDGWAFIFDVWLTYCDDAIRSLDYGLYKRTVESIVNAWLSAGISVRFVFDGPFLPSKLPTVVSRRAQVAVGNQSFMTSSAKSRMSRSFQQSIGITPPLLHSATLDALRTSKEQGKDVEITFAPTEADSLVAEIATEKRRGYALSQDSDFFVLCSRGQGCAYVPLDSIHYLIRPEIQAPSAEQPRGSSDAPTVALGDLALDDGFQQVSSKKKRGIKRITPSAPNVRIDGPSSSQINRSPSMDELSNQLESIHFRAYPPHDLAAHLQLPPTLLPLFAAIVGNDHTTSIQSSILLKHISVEKRISTVAELLRHEWVRLKNETKASANAAARRGQTRFAMTSMGDFDDGRSDVGSSATATPTRNTPGANRQLAASTVVPHDPVRVMVEAVADKLIAQSELSFGPTRHHITTGERELIVDSIIDSAATYSLLTHSDAPHLASPSALFFGEAMSLLASFKHQEEHIAHPNALRRYRDAYHFGHFRETLIETLTQRTFITKLLPEDVDVPTSNASTMRELRQWLYAVLFEVWGLAWARKQWELPRVMEKESETETREGNGSVFAPQRGYKEGELPDDVISVDTESSSSTIDDDGDEFYGDEEELPSRPASVVDVRDEDKPAAGVKEYLRIGTLYNHQMVRIRPLVDLLRYGANVSIRATNEEKEESPNGAAKIMNNAEEDSLSRLPPSLAELLGKHEASQPGPSDIDASIASSQGRNGKPESDPTPPPLVTMPLAVRTDLFLFAHHAFTEQVKALPVDLLLPAAVLRFLIVSEYKRLGGASKRRHNWSRNEVKVAIRSMVPRKGSSTLERIDGSLNDVYPSTRAIHLSSLVQLALDTSCMLAQALLLPVDEPDWSLPHACFSAPIFHLGMARIHAEASEEEARSSSPSTINETLTKLLSANVSRDDMDRINKSEAAIVEGIEEFLGIDEAELRRERKAQKAAKKRETRAAAAAAAAAAEAEQRVKSMQQRQPSTVAISMARKKTSSANNAFAALLDQND